MDGGVDGQLYATECSSPFTSTSSMDSSVGAASVDGGAIENAPVAVQQPQPRRKTSSRKVVIESVTTIKDSSHATTSHKRPLSNSNSNNNSGMGLKEMLSISQSQAKRIKCDAGSSSRQTIVLNTLTNASPQLLQQLMAPTKSQAVKQQQQQLKGVNRMAMDVDSNAEATTMMMKVNAKMGATRSSSSGNEIQRAKKQQAPSNSVLMNLLVSGCDVSAGYMCLAPMRPRKAAKV